MTAGGLLFIGASNFDRKFRAFDKATGELLWETTLPFSGNATPATYEVDGRQYVVIAAAAAKIPSKVREECTSHSRFPGLPRRPNAFVEDGRDARPPSVNYSALSDTQRETAVAIFRGETRMDSATSQLRNPGITSVLPLSRPR